MGINVHRDTFSGRGEGGNNGAVKIVRFIDFGKEIEGWGAGFGIEDKGCYPWIGLGEDRQW